MTSTTNTSGVAASEYKLRAAFTVATKDAAASQLFARTAGAVGPDLRGDIEGTSTALYKVEGSKGVFFNVVQSGKQVGNANVRVMPRGVEALVVTVNGKSTFLTFTKEIATEARVAMGLDAAKLGEVKAANVLKKAEKAAANDEAAKVAA